MADEYRGVSRAGKKLIEVSLTSQFIFSEPRGQTMDELIAIVTRFRRAIEETDRGNLPV